MNIKLEKNEYTLLMVTLMLLAIACLGPVVLQPAHQHDFAGQQFFGYLPYAANALSNLPFALWGLAGLLALLDLKSLQAIAGLCALFFVGLITTAATSSWYHLQPNDAGLGIDRLGMTVAFAGLLGLAAADRVSLRAGAIVSGLILILGPISVWFWSISGNVLPWLVLQFGGMALVLFLASFPPVQNGLAIRWGVVIAIYGLAKVFELADHVVYDLSAHVVSGHTLKHITASFAAWPIISTLRKPSKILSFAYIRI